MLLEKQARSVSRPAGPAGPARPAGPAGQTKPGPGGRSERRFKRTLGLKITVWIGLLLLVILAALYVVSARSQIALVENRELEAALALSGTVLASIRAPLLVGDQETVQRVFDEVKGQNRDLLIYLLDAEGTVKRSSEHNLLGQKSPAQDLDRALTGEQVSGVQFNERLGYTVSSVMQPIPNEEACTACHSDEGRLLGVLRLERDFRPVERAMVGSRWRAVAVAAGGFVAAVLALFFLLRYMHKPLARVTALIRKIAGGKLDRTSGLNQRDEIGELAFALDQMVASLRSMVLRIQSSSLNVATTSEDISRNTGRLAEGTQSQAATIEETSAAIEQLSASIEHVAGEARSQTGSLAENAGSVEEVKDAAEEVRRTLESVMAGIESISRSSEKITGIVNLITDIASQTNLLALNASIEAARAGEHGRGFAVVADEVSKLAERSATSAKEIEELIHESEASVAAGNQMIGRLAEAIARQIDAIREVSQALVEINEMSRNISAATEEQSVNARLISKAIENLNTLIQQSAHSADAVSSASGRLAGMAGQLKRLAARFEVQKSQPLQESAVEKVEEPVRRLPRPGTPEIEYGIREKKEQPVQERLKKQPATGA